MMALSDERGKDRRLEDREDVVVPAQNPENISKLSQLPKFA